MTTPVLTFTKSTLAVNQPISLGSVRGVLGVLDFSTYATNGTAVTGDMVGLSKVLFVFPVGSLTDQAALVKVLDTDPTTIKLNSAEGTEFTDNTDGGEFLCFVVGT